MIEQSIIEFEKQVMVMAKQLYPGKSCFSARELNPIREKLKGAQEAMRVAPFPKEEPKKEEPKKEEPKKEEPKKEVAPEPKQKRKYTKRK